MKQFRLPDPGEGLVEAEIVTWRVAVGDEVKVNDIVVEIETSKSLVELPVPYAGTVSALLAAEGELVEVGAPLITIDDKVGPPPVPAGSPSGQEAPAGSPSGQAAPAGPAVPVQGARVQSTPGSAPSAGGQTGEAQTGEAQTGEAQTGEAPIEDGMIGGAAPGGRVAVLVGYGPRTTEAKRRPRKAPPGREFDEEAHEQVADTFSTGAPVSFRSDVRQPLTPVEAEPVGDPLPGPGAAPAEPAPARSAVLAKPPVRKLAKDLGVDLVAVPATGVGGVITRADVEGAAARLRAERDRPEATPAEGAGATGTAELAADLGPSIPSTAADATVARPRLAAGEDTRIPVRGVRKATAEAMVASAFTAPHVTEWLTCDVSATMELLERLKARREFRGVRLSPLLLVAKAVCLALGRTPELNSHFDEAAQEIVLKGTVNLGIAAATPRGLLVPTIRNAQTLDLLGLATAINELVSVAREGRTQPADTTGGTFTLTNVGVFGVDAGTPILNPGQAGILCLGAIARRPWVVGGSTGSGGGVAGPGSGVPGSGTGISGPEAGVMGSGDGAQERIEPRWVTTLAVSFDHRVVDGEQGSRFLAHVGDILSDPGLGLL